MKIITEQAAQHLLASCEGSKIEQRGFARVLVIPTFDIDSGEQTVEERLIEQDEGLDD